LTEPEVWTGKVVAGEDDASLDEARAADARADGELEVDGWTARQTSR